MQNNQHINNSSFLKKIFNYFLEDRFTNLGYLPRWIIFCIDVCIVLFASVVTHFIVTNLTYIHFDTYSIFLRYLITVSTYVFFFFAFKTYAGVIRHSSFIDALRLLLATFASFLALITLNYTHFYIIGTKIFLFPVLLIHFITTFLLLLLFRVIVKFVYEKYVNFNTTDNTQRVLIFGIDSNAVAVANALSLEQPKKYNVVAFIDKQNSKEKKQLLGLPIINKNEEISKVITSFKAEALIIADTKLSKKKQLQIVEDCLENNLKILTIHKVENWQSEKEISKNIKKFDINDLLERKPILLNTSQISLQLANKNILISGAAGSIGSEIVIQILNFNPKAIILIDQAETPLYNLVNSLKKDIKNIDIIPYVADVKDKFFLDFVFKNHNPQVVYHAAAYKHVPLMEQNPYQAVLTNVIGTKNIADISLKHNIESFVMVSTDKAVNPSNIMGASKRIAEQYVQSLAKFIEENENNQTKFITTRFGNVLGSNGSVVPLFTKQIQEGGPVTVTHPEIIRYFMTIPEACQLVLEAGSMGNGGEIFIFDMGKPVKIIDLAYKMIKLAGFTPEKEIKINITGLRPGEKLYEELLNDSAKTLLTHHEKIMIAIDEMPIKYSEISNYILMLENTCKTLDTIEMVRIMKQIVPEFKSMNSTFEQLD